MKFDREVTPKGVCIPIAALKLGKLQDAGKLKLHTLDNALVLLKRRMTAPELLTAVQQLSELAAELLAHLAGVCGGCEDCGQEGCPYDSLGDVPLDLPDDLRQAAGIPKDVKLCAEVNEEDATVTLSAAGYRYDLRDIPPGSLEVLAEAGVCLGELEQHMIMEDAVYGS